MMHLLMHNQIMALVLFHGCWTQDEYYLKRSYLSGSGVILPCAKTFLLTGGVSAPSQDET